MYFVIRILFVFLFFWILFPSWERIYFYHFGEVTNSDAFYPLLFARDFWFSPSFVTGWSLPPSNVFFPDVLFFLLGNHLTNDVFILYSCYAAFCFIFTYYFFRQFGLPNYASLVGAVFVLKLGEIFPGSWGQFYLPGFHAGEFFLVLCFFILLKEENKNRIFFILRFILLVALSLFSELWFLVHSALPLLILFFIDKKNQKIKIIFYILISIVFYQIIVFYSGHLGFRAFVPNEFPIKKLIWEKLADFSANPLSYLYSTFVENSKLPASKFLLPAYWFLVLIFLLTLKKFNQRIRQTETLHSSLFYLYLIFSPACGLLFLTLTGLEFNARYLLILPISCFGLFCYFLKRRKILLKAALFSFFAFVSVTSNRFAPDPKLKEQIQLTMTKQNHRIECTIQTWKDWGKPNGISTYWPVKYLKTLSSEPIRLVPLTESGDYYPWNHNRNWEKGISDLKADSFSFAIVEGDKKEVWNRKAIAFRSCENWSLLLFVPLQ